MLKVLVLFFILTDLSLGQPSTIDTPWEKKKTDTRAEVWVKQIGGVGGQATLTIIKDKGNTTYAVFRPCPATGQQFLITWSNQAKLAFGLDCTGGKIIQEPAAPWVKYFMPLPYDLYASR